MTTARVPPYLAEHAVFRRCPIVANRQVARDTYRLRLECPEIGGRIRPGQFVMLRLAGVNDPLLGRALALYDTYVGVDGTMLGLDLVYLVAGKLTRRLAASEMGVEVELWGPLGNGFSTQPADHLVMVAGGIGQTPFLAVALEALARKTYGSETAKGWADRVSFCYGVRTADYFAGLDDFERAGVTLRLSTDDGSRGRQGLVTEDLDNVEGVSRVVCCGPEPMMAAVARWCERSDVPCEVSLETPMACGIGACFTCVAPIRESSDPADWDYQRTCVEGPVFDARRIAWDAHALGR